MARCDEFMFLLVVVVSVCGVAAASVVKPPPAAPACQPDKLTVYKVVLHTFWSRDRFPKHYPDWRPPAQWSKLVGRSHDQSFVLFRLGTRASPAVKNFAETGRTDLLEDLGQGDGGIFDDFIGPAIKSGSGRTVAEFFVDGNHSRVSLMSKITPSPDWFIGIDSFDLCVDGHWIDSITIEVDPVDAGTDNGFTFTAPNWPTEPQGIVYRMTSRYPSHPAGSFYYPYMKRLPPIGTFQFIKVREYELSEVFHHNEDDRRYEVLKMEHITHNTIEVLNNNDIETEMEEERQEQERLLTQVPLPVTPLRALFTTSTTTTTTTTTDATEPTSSNAIEPGMGGPAVLARAAGKDAILNSIVETYQSTGKEQHRKKYRGKPRKNVRKIRPPRDCRVSEWSAWGECSKSCGIGEMQRRREVIKHARRGGQVCPPLLDTKWCGSARACSKGYFNW